MNIQAMAPIPTTTTTSTDDSMENTPKGNFMCPNPECGKTFGTRAGLRYHQKNANRPGCGPVGETLAQVESDGKEKEDSTPKKQKKSSSGEAGEFKCTIDDCDKSYTTKAGLRYHITSHHGVPKLTKEQREQLKKKRRKEKRAAKLAEASGQAASAAHVAAQIQQSAQVQQSHQQVQQVQQQQQQQQQQLQQQQLQQQQLQQQQQQMQAQMQMQNPHQAYGYSQPAQDYSSYGMHQSSYAQSSAQKHQQNAQYYPQQAQAQGNLTQLQHQLQQTLQQTPAYASNPANVGGDISTAHLQPLNQFNKNYQYYPQQQQAAQMGASTPISSFLNNPAANGNHVWTSQIQGNPQAAYAQSNAAGVAQMRQQSNPAPGAYAVPQWGSTNAAYLPPQAAQRK